MLFYSHIFPLYHSYLRYSFIISHSRIFARDNNGGILPITKRELRDRDYKEALAEIQQRQNAWIVGKKKIQEYGEQIKNTSGSTKKLTDNLSKENQVVRDSVQEFIDSGLAFDEYAKKKEDAFENDKLSQKPKDFKQSIKGMASSALATVGNMAINAVGGILLEQLAVGLVSVVDGIIHESEYKIADGQEAKENIVQQTKAYESQKETLEGLTAEYRRLAKGVKISGNAIENVSLTDEKFQSFLDTSNQIAEISPTLVRTWDSQGNAILAAGTNSGYLNSSIEDYLKLQRDITHISNKENIQTHYEGILEEVKQYKKSQKELKTSLDDQKETTEAYISLRDSLKDASAGKDLEVALPTDKSSAFSKTLRKEGIDFSGKYLQEADQMAYTIRTSKLTEDQIKDLNVLAEQYEYTSKANEKLIESQIKEQEVLSKAKYKEISDDLQSYIETSNMFDNLGQTQSDIFKNGINNILKNIDFSALQKPIEEAGGLPNWLDKNLIAPMVSGTDAVRTEWEALFNIEKLKETDSIGVWAKERNKHLNKLAELTGYTPKEIAQSMGYGSLDENGDFYWTYKNRIDKATSHMFGENYSKAQRKEMSSYLNSLTGEEFEVAMDLVINSDGAITSVEQLKSTVEKQMGTATQISLDDELSLDSMKTRVSDMQSSLAVFSTAMNETNSAAGLTYDTINALSSSFDTLVDSGVIKKNDLFSLFDRTASGIRLNEEALRELSSVQEEVIKQNLAKSVKAQYDAYKEAKDNVGEYLNGEIIEQSDVEDAWGVYQKALQQQALFESIISDRAQWFAGTTEAYANYDTTLSKLSSLKNLRKDSQGMEWIGTNEFRQGVDYFFSGNLDTASGEEIAHVYDTLMPMVQDWYQINEDGSRNVSGSIDAFIEDITALPSILGDSASSIDKENKKATLSIKEMADAYGVSGEALEDFAGLFESLGWDVSWVDGFTQSKEQGTIENPAERTFSDKETQATYDGIVSGIQNADEATKGLVDSLSQYTSEELRAINYSDGLYDTTAPEGAEKAVDNLRQSLGLSTDQTQLLLTALEAMGVIELEPKVDNSEITDTTNELKELQEQGKISSTIDLDFNVDTMSIDEIDSKVDELKQEKIHLETEGDTSGIEAIETIIDSLENRSIDLKIQAQIDKGASYESLLNMSDEQLSKTLQIDSSQVDEARVKLEELSQITTEAPVTVKIDEAQLSTLTEGTKNVTVTAKAEGKEEVDALQDSIDNVHGKVVPVKANVFGTDEVNELSEAIERVNGRIVSVGANVFGTNEVWGLASAISMVQSKTVTVTTNYVTNGSVGGKAAGTMLSPAHSSGTAYNVLNTLPAHVSGKVSLEKDETALVNELGTESIIRDGVWKLIPGKMHTENLKKGDIILNAKQTEDLLRHGKTNSHARAYASGTLSTGKILSKAYASGSVTDEVDKMVDWFERLVAKLEDRVTLYEKKSDNAVGLHSQLRYLEKAQKTNEELIKHYKEAQKKYKGQASSVAKELGLSDSLRKKVENGSVNFEKLSDDDKKRVDAYSKWYDKIRDCTSAIEDLNAAQKDLINKQLDKVEKKYDNILGTFKGNVDVLEAQKEYRKAAGYSEAPHSDYYKFVEKQMQLQDRQTEIIASKIEAYKKQLSKIKNKKSPEYKQGIAKLKEFEVEFYESKTAAVEFRNEMYQLELQMKQWQVEKYDRAFSKQTARLDYLKATNYKNSVGATEKDIAGIISTNDSHIQALYAKREQISKMMQLYGSNSEKFRELANDLAECDEEILKLGADTAQWRKEILALRFEPFYKAQDALDEVIQDYEIIRSMMDSESFFNDDGSYSEYGMANIALLQESTEAEKQKIANYKKQLENIQKLYDNGSMTKEDYESYTKEILDGIRNSSQALSNYNKEILDMYEQQITKENELLQTNINKRQEALDAKENYYNYDKTIKKKSKDINALKAQIAALEGTSNAAAKARLETLKAELAEAEEDMDDTVHNHEVEMKKYGYDQLSKEADTALENTLDALVKNTDMQKAVIDNMLSQVTASYEGAYGKIQDIIKETGLMVSDAFKDYITSVPDFNTGNPNDYEADDDVSNMDTSQIPGHSQSGQDILDKIEGDNANPEDAQHPNKDWKHIYTKVSPTSVSVEVGKTVKLTATLDPKPKEEMKINWSSDNKSIATVSGSGSSGSVKGVKYGTTTIIAKGEYAYNPGKCKVKVLPKNYSKNVTSLNSYLKGAGQTLSDSEKEKIIYNAFGAEGKDSTTARNKAKEEAKKILVKKWYNGLRDREKGKPIPSGTSALARHFMEKNKSVNRYELYELAKILGVKTPPADQYESWGSSVKNKLLAEVKKYGYAKGGLVDYGRYIPINTLDELARSNGEWGMVAARRKELILNEHLSELLQTGLPTAVDIIRKFNIDNTSGTGSPRIYNDNTVYEVNIYVDKISNDTDIKKLAHAIDAELTKAHVKDMRKLIG